MLTKENLIQGNWIKTEERMAVTNPANKEVIGYVPQAGTLEAERAVTAAHEAFPAWAARTAEERSQLLYRWYQLIETNKEQLARMMTMEQGKPLQEARGEIDYANNYILWYAEEAKRLYGESIPASSTAKRIFVKKEPVGVVAAITPWNFPAAMITRKVAPALAAGCTVVTKPASETPFTAILLMELAQEAGMPAGVINLVTGDAQTIVGAWQADQRVKKLTFTGSTPVGKQLMQDAAGTMKRLSLELGGHAPFIVTKNADLERAVEGAIISKFRNAGQTCICSNRMYIDEEIADRFIERFTEKVSTLVVGDGLHDGVDIGPLINKAALNKVKEHIDDAKKRGATLVMGGEMIMEDQGYFMTPAVLTGVTDEMLCMQEETFGPLAPITTFRTVEEALKRANHSPFGLAAYAYSNDIAEAMQLADGLQYGVIGLNDGAPSAAQAPFGGFKESGYGREGSHHGIESYVEVKYISLGGLG
ncbi:NAD-dependent succinate-semialdehyde dehydrogenase [Mechercharimyces sp. CAU 1602]|uniref:NAD-dependent succinate-semialdehyde dehydrogenase n=1 Tax=Mechercharimyces sp. CAU 1602 TaxID=2973933 RepID=UPI0021635084|nr:NAD-dependent succinate-semialdehyde dehydrogenase [Mechercharimyces sp. CAU 1602]MCS1350043.1 NAD-dependent succinate-semialdehyde dehydrogenase [Mechercharimyces sp. CAU 1602]